MNLWLLIEQRTLNKVLHTELTETHYTHSCKGRWCTGREHIGNLRQGVYPSLIPHFQQHFGYLYSDVQPAPQTQHVQNHQTNVPFQINDLSWFLNIYEWSYSPSHPGLKACCHLCFLSTLFPAVHQKPSQSQFGSPVCLSVLSLFSSHCHQGKSDPHHPYLDHCSSFTAFHTSQVFYTVLSS